MSQKIDTAEEEARRADLIAYVKETDWNGPNVIDLCHCLTLEKVEAFVHALKHGGPISMYFRWAWDEDNGGPFVVLQARDPVEAYRESAMRRVRLYRDAGHKGESLRRLADPHGKMGDDEEFLSIITSSGK